MKFLMKKVNIFCYKHPRFGIPNLMLYIAIANVGIYLIDLFGSSALSAALEFDLYAILHGQVWRVLTFVLVPLQGDILFLRGSGIFFVLLSAYFYYWVGGLLEREWGLAKFSIFYFMGILLNILIGFIMGYTSMVYVNMSMFFSFAVLFPDVQLLLFYILPIKAKWLALIDAAFFVWDILVSARAGNLLGMLLPIIAILNFLVFFWGDLTDILRRGRQRRKHQTSAQTINFKQEIRRIEHEQKTRSFTRKCEVCGRTDADFPDLEFRYCSRCQGYHCFCIDHINAHRHFTE